MRIPLIFPSASAGGLRPRINAAVVAARPIPLVSSPAMLSGVIDTGASRSTVPQSLFRPADVERLALDEVTLGDGSKRDMHVVTVRLQLVGLDRPVEMKRIYVSRSSYMLLGIDFLLVSRARVELSMHEKLGALIID